MAIQTITLEQEFKADTKIVYEQFLDLRKYGTHHPVMTDVKIVSDNTTEYVEYEIDEVVPVIGFIKMYPNYRAKVFEVEKYKHLQYTSQVKPTIFLKIDILFAESAGTTKVTETISVTGNKIITSMFLGILKKAHLKLFNNLNDSLSV
ncbi:MAG: hypothetical protein V4677_05365 [Bacteroidota bacterium]